MAPPDKPVPAPRATTGLYLSLGFWQGHAQGARTVGGEPIALVGHSVLGRVEQGMCGQHMPQSLYHLALSLGALHVLRLFG
jgi:hypothetical protein